MPSSLVATPWLGALLGGLAGVLGGFVLAVAIASIQQRRGFKTAPSIGPHAVLGGLVGNVAGAFGAWRLGLWGPVMVGLVGWPLIVGLIGVGISVSGRGRRDI
jgi:hypothetical protein